MNIEEKTLRQSEYSGEKHHYHKPLLTVYGEIRTVTFAPTLEDADESAPGTWSYDSGGAPPRDSSHSSGRW